MGSVAHLMQRSVRLAAAIVVAAADGTGAAELPPPDRPLSLQSRTLTGDWGGKRPALEANGVTFNLYLNDQYQSVLRGGLRTKGPGRNSASMDAFVTFDMEKLELVPQAEVLLHLQSNWGAGVNGRTGAAYEVNDDADGDLGLHVAQLWYRQHFWERKLAVTLGFLDYQTIVDRNAYANSEDRQFWSQSLDNNPLVPLAIGLGTTLTWRPVKWWTLTLGAADGQSVLYKPGFSTTFHDEAWFFGYAEQAFSFDLPSKRGPLPGNCRVGLVYDPRPRNEFTIEEYPDPPPRDRDVVGYVSVDQMLLRETAGSDEGLGVFGRFGYRDSDTTRLNKFWSGGVQYKGLLPGRGDDVLGAGMSFARASSLYRQRVDDTADDETVYELYYAIAVSKWLVITPDLQYIDNPGASSAAPASAVVGGVRVRVSF